MMVSPAADRRRLRTTVPRSAPVQVRNHPALAEWWWRSFGRGIGRFGGRVGSRCEARRGGRQRQGLEAKGWSRG